MNIVRLKNWGGGGGVFMFPEGTMYGPMMTK